MTLQTGDAAPAISLFTHDKQPWTLADQTGQTLLLFFPGAFTSVCTTELNDVSNDLDRYTNAGVNVVGISTDSPFALAEFHKVNGLRFPLLSDHDAETAKAYGAKYDRDFTPMKLDRIAKRAAFLVGEDGTLRYAEVLENAGQQPNFEAIKAVITG